MCACSPPCSRAWQGFSSQESLPPSDPPPPTRGVAVTLARLPARPLQPRRAGCQHRRPPLSARVARGVCGRVGVARCLGVVAPLSPWAWSGESGGLLPLPPPCPTPSRRRWEDLRGAYPAAAQPLEVARSPETWQPVVTGDQERWRRCTLRVLEALEEEGEDAADASGAGPGAPGDWWSLDLVASDSDEVGEGPEVP